MNRKEYNQGMEQHQHVAVAARAVENRFSTAEPLPSWTALQPPENPLVREPTSRPGPALSKIM
jgi:hypothetical protein